MVPEINLHFFSTTISGIQEYAASHGYSIMICQSMESLKTEKSNIQMLVSNRVDGLLISLSSETKTYEHLEQLIQKKIPIILFDRISDELDVSKVIVDDHDGAFKGVELLLKTGCRRIAYIGGPENLYVSNQRMKGYLDALQSYNIQPDPSLISHCHELHDEPIEVAKRLLDMPERPDAIFCMNDPVAIIVMQVLKGRGVRIPDEISIVGFTNEPVSQYIEPSLTTIAQPAYQMGQATAELFIQQLDQSETATPVTKVLPTELVIRNSTRKLPYLR